ncbi:hypothetical protein EYZ11_007161 [Aspergillus tanneri]|uniref:Mevalonate kinase n=1 Tax=Aspergillus tanneri TaxID=1220188 RepID=A0A4S3JDP3_9EURO|nr:Mevalonate kinase [Aspergillus tanneri]KAA8652904.1 Mevalonate kinase [Aspergillus tanneri]THC93369.1 hypothetical protein EYZ11_007161 [Aspergillus tanneri]
MDHFIVSAPGKIILHGEYAALYGKPAIAAAIELRSYLLVSAARDDPRSITLQSDNGIDCTWNIDDLPWPQTPRAQNDSPESDHSSPDSGLRAAIRAFLQTSAYTTSSSSAHKCIVEAFLYLYIALGSPQRPGAVYSIYSRLPIGAGLGSSASISVCMTTAILIQSGTLEKDYSLTPKAHTPVDLITRWSFIVEHFFHGTPSGVDNATSTRGGVVFFQRDPNSVKPVITPLAGVLKLPVLLVDTCESRSTASVAADVEELLAVYPKLVHLILNYIHLVTEFAKKIIEGTSQCEDPDSIVEQLGRLLPINHNLLVALGASHPRVERVRSIISSGYLGWTKLTGAGRGGCTLSLLHPKMEEQLFQETKDRLVSEGFHVYRSILGCSGAAVLQPTVAYDNNGRTATNGASAAHEILKNPKIENIDLHLERLFQGKWRHWRVSQ